MYRDYFLQIWVLSKRLKCTLSPDLASFHYYYLVCEVKEINRVSDEDACLRSQETLKNLLEDFFSHVGIQCRNRIIHQHYIAVLVDCSSQAQPSFLSSR